MLGGLPVEPRLRIGVITKLQSWTPARREYGIGPDSYPLTILLNASTQSTSRYRDATGRMLGRMESVHRKIIPRLYEGIKFKMVAEQK
jgi:hypothetical protein